MLKYILPDEPKKWVKESQDQLGIFILRSMFALLWFTQAGIKIVDRSKEPNADFHGFLGDLLRMEGSNPISFVSFVLRRFLIPNYEFIVVLVIITELFIATSLGLGLVTRLGSLVGGVMTLFLWILTLGWDEWFWTYPLIFFPHILFFLSHSGRIIGLDKVLLNQTENKLFRRIT